MDLFRREPALWVGLIGSVLDVLAGFNLHISHAQVGLVNAAVVAVLAVGASAAVRPFPVPLLVGASSAVLAAGVGFGLHITTAQIGLVNAAVVAVAAWILRGHVSPVSRDS